MTLFSFRRTLFGFALSCGMAVATMAQPQIYWCDIAIGQILRSDLDGGNTTAIVAQNFPAYHTVDYENDRIYWTDTGTRSVHSINLDGGDETVLIADLTEPQGIDMTANNEIILVDFDRIVRYSTEGDMIANVVSDLDDPTDLIVHDGQVFWGERGPKAIYSAPVNGGSKQLLVSNVSVMADIEVNTLTDELYWTQTPGILSGSGIFKANTDGSGRTTVIEDFINGIAIDGFNETIYWTSSAAHKIFRADLADIGKPFEHVTEFLLDPREVIIDEDNSRLLFINQQYGNILYAADLATGLGLTPLQQTEVYRPARFVVDTINDHLYWVNTSGPSADDEAAAIVRSKLDGSDLEQLISYPQVKKPFGLAVDIPNGKIYWTDINDKRVASADLDGTNVETVYNTGLLAPRGLSLDQANQRLYWTDANTSKIQACKVDGSNPTDLIISGLEAPYEVFHVPGTSILYFTDYGNGFIGRYGLTGEGFEVLYTTNNPGFDRPNGVFVDTINEKIYFTIDNMNEMLARIDLDGSNFEEIPVPDINSPHDIEVIGLVDPTSSVYSPDTHAERRSTLFPNPFKDRINITANASIDRVRVFNIDGGQAVPVTIERQQPGSIDLVVNAAIPPGQYIIEVLYEDGMTETHIAIRIH